MGFTDEIVLWLGTRANGQFNREYVNGTGEGVDADWSLPLRIQHLITNQGLVCLCGAQALIRLPRVMFSLISHSSHLHQSMLHSYNCPLLINNRTNCDFYSVRYCAVEVFCNISVCICEVMPHKSIWPSSLLPPAVETHWPVTPGQPPVLLSLVEYQITINQRGLRVRENKGAGRAARSAAKCHLHPCRQHSALKPYHQAVVHAENISFHFTERIMSIVAKMWGLLF